MSRVKAEFNHKICAERYGVIGNTPVTYVRYFEHCLSQQHAFCFAHLFIFLPLSLKEYRAGDKNRVGRVTGNSGFCFFDLSEKIDVIEVEIKALLAVFI